MSLPFGNGASAATAFLMQIQTLMNFLSIGLKLTHLDFLKIKRLKK